MANNLFISLPAGKRLVWYLAAEEYFAKNIHTLRQKLGVDFENVFFTWIVLPTVIFGRHQVMQNEVNLAYTAYSNMVAQVQMAGAKIMETTPLYTTIDSAYVPLKADSPKKLIMLVVFVFMACIIATAKLVYVQFLGKRNDNHEQSGCQEDFDITQYDAHYTVPVSEKKMYITFDCGYENGFTPDMLDVLKEEQVAAAFFVTQTFIRDNVDLVKTMKEEGHLVCNHTVTHPSMPGKSVEEQRKELLDCENYMKQATAFRN